MRERNLARNTQCSYRDMLCLLLPRLVLQSRTTVDVLEVEDLSADAVRNFLAVIEEKRGCSVATRNQRLSAITISIFLEIVTIDNDGLGRFGSRTGRGR